MQMLLCTSYGEKHKHAGVHKLWRSENTLVCTSCGEKHKHAGVHRLWR